MPAIRKYGKSLETPTEALRLDKLGFDLQLDWRDGYTTLGNNLDIYHGIYFGANPADQHLKKCPTRNHIFNHTHRINSCSKGGYSAYNIGWLGNQDHEVFKYGDRFKRADWENGFAEVFIDDNGNNIVNTIKCINDRFYLGGKLY